MRRPMKARTALLAGALAALPMAAAPMLPALAQSGAQSQSQALVALPSFAPIVKAAKPAVVTVVTETRVQGPRGTGQPLPPGLEEFMDRFMPDGMQPFGGPQGPRGEAPTRQGLGSGFVIDADGIIVTNRHVIQNAESVTVILADGREFQADVVGSDDRVDLAVLQVEADAPLPTVAWGDSDAVQVGDWSVAIGNPLGLDGSVTAGIVSARGRNINAGPYDDFLQVDAAINRGNSGGPLLNLAGQVIGVNTAILSPTGGNIGLGFAIPAAQARTIIEDLMDDGVVQRGWIGVSIQPVTEQIAGSLGLPDEGGALVAEVMEDSPAAAAGLRPGDVVTGFAGEPVEELRDLTRRVADAPLGEETRITVWRNGETQTLTVRPRLMDQQMASAGAATRGEDAVAALGLGLAAGPEGRVRVARLAPGSPAAEAGLRPGDAILSVDQTEVDSPRAVAEAVAAARQAGRDTLLALIAREGSRRFVTIEVPSA